MRRADIGILLPTRALLLRAEPPRDLDGLLSMAENLETSGFQGLWVGDSLLASPRPDVVVTLSAIAARTRTIRLGTGILIGSLRHPVTLAHQLATLDVASSGRLTVGVGYSSGHGVYELEHAIVGVDAGTRHARAREGIEVMRALWTDSPASHEGRFFEFEDVDLAPKPVQAGGPPVWLHGMRGPKTLRRVAEYGDGWINNLPTAAEFAANLGIVRECAAESGKNAERFHACHYSTIRIEGDGNEARRNGRAFMQAYYGGMNPDEIERIECCRYGTPEFVVDELARFVEAGAGTLILRLASEDQQAQIELCTERVLPVLNGIR